VLLIRFRRDAIVRMLRLTDAFVWEDLPTTDPVTGSLTMAAWIPRIQKFTNIITTTGVAFHVVQTTIRFTLIDDRPFMFGTWYPFDATKSPTYELINISQVKASVIRWVYSFILYIVWVECKRELQNNVIYTLLTVCLWHFGLWASQFEIISVWVCLFGTNVCWPMDFIWLDIRTFFLRS